jgi:hypothetical protein
MNPQVKVKQEGSNPNPRIDSTDNSGKEERTKLNSDIRITNSGCILSNTSFA